MKFSYKWLKEYFAEELLSPEKLEEIVLLKSFEIESVEQVGDDTIFDFKITPNRSHDCLSHFGLAKEISAITGLKLNRYDLAVSNKTEADSGGFGVEVLSNKCRRYIGQKITGIKIGPSPKELCEKLESLGERSINNLVDITNIVMFETGQPLHAFDLDKLASEKIIVRDGARENLTTLDGKNVYLDSDSLVIADLKEALVVAGIKGGKKAEIDENTKNVVLESANFDPVSVRKTSRRINIATESSKRFENEISPEIAEIAMNRLVEMISKYASDSDTKIYQSVDHYPNRRTKFITGLGLKNLQTILGVEISLEEVVQIFDQMYFKYEILTDAKKTFVEELKKYLRIPYETPVSISRHAPHKFDCSSLVAYSATFAGLSIPRISIDQFAFSTHISEKEIEPGDLIFSNTKLMLKNGVHHETVAFLKGIKIEHGVDHVGVYIGNGEVLHTSSKTKCVAIEKLSDSEYFKNIVGYGRIFDSNETRFVVEIPAERIDLMSKGVEFGLENCLAEEIGRIYGYDKIPDQKLPLNNFTPQINKIFQTETLIRKIMIENGFSEIFNYSFVKNGEIMLENPISQDVPFLRANLKDGMIDSIEKNILNADFLGQNQIKIFEIGNVFLAGKEKRVLGIAVKNKQGIKKPNSEETISFAIQKLEEVFGDKLTTEISEPEQFVQFDLENFPTEKIGNEYHNFDFQKDATYRPISIYPFVLRDIAVWINTNDNVTDLLNIIKNHAGELLVSTKLFDKYEKDSRTSYAFRLVFQSQEKTLTDEEVNKVMEKIYAEIKSQNDWEIR